MIVKQWCSTELEFHETQGSHSVVCGIDAVFTAPSGRKIYREAFWDGEDLYKIRFTPTELGEWKYTVKGLHKGEETGSLSCVSYDGELPIYKHGFLKVEPEGKYLCHADNTPFLWLGDTHWEFVAEERFHESNDPRFDSQFKAIVDRRAEQEFNVYQCNFHVSMNGGWFGNGEPYFIQMEDEYEPNLMLLRDNLDEKMAYLAEKGFCIAIGFSWGSSILLPGAVDYYKMAARYLTARYGSYPVIWTLAGESGGYDTEKRKLFLDGWRKIALETEKWDGYHHLQTTHYTNERPFASYYNEEPWFDFTLNQAGHGDYPIDCRPFKEHRKKYPDKPFVEGESMYEYILTLEPNGRRRATPAMLRRVAYMAMQCGGCGYTYGCQGMWFLQWDESSDEKAAVGFGSNEPWYKGIDYPGAYQMKYFKKFYESIDWYKLEPVSADLLEVGTNGRAVITLHKEDLEALFMPCVSADKERKTIAAYFSDGNRYPIGIHELTQKKYKAQWFFPQNGTYQVIEEEIMPEGGVWFSPVKPNDEDAVLLLTSIE